MGGFFGVASKSECALDLFYGIDYHSHLGTRRGGMATHGEEGFNRAIHNIENSPFRTKFDKDVDDMKGNIGIGCISDFEPQPLLIQSHIGSFAITTVGKINNADQLMKLVYEKGHAHFQEMTNGQPSEYCRYWLRVSCSSCSPTLLQFLAAMSSFTNGIRPVLHSFISKPLVTV